MSVEAPDVRRAITASAKKHLSLINFRQMGKSRVWIKDHGIWIAFVEFQPSAWVKGSYLNVGASWMWNEKTQLTFDFLERVSSFRNMDEKAFLQNVAEDLVELAVSEASRIEKNFSSLDCISKKLLESCSQERFNWPEYNAAVASGLAGDGATAQSLLELVINYQASHRPGGELEIQAKKFSALVQNKNEFTASVEAIARKNRLNLGLSPEFSLENQN